MLTRTDQPDRTLPLPRRDLGELLAEELRRLDPDEPYAEALEAATGTSGPVRALAAPHARVARPGRVRRPGPALSMS